MTILLFNEPKPLYFYRLTKKMQKVWEGEHTTKVLTTETEFRAWLREMPCGERIQ